MKYILIIYWGVGGVAPTISPFANVFECDSARNAIAFDLYQQGFPKIPVMHCVEMKQ